MKKRTRRTLLIVAGILVVLAVAVFLRSKAPPEAARLLPESDGILYVNLKPFHTFLHKDLRPPKRVPEYEEFVQAIGFDWEKDLDEVAMGLHRMPDPAGPNGPVAYSMVLVGKLTGQKLNGWLDAHAARKDSYAGHTIYEIPAEGRTVRVSQIGYDMVAVSNFPTTEMIHSIIDRRRAAALPFAGSTLLGNHYHEVPLLSLAWGVGQIGLPFNESGAISIFGFQLPLESDSTIVASLTPALSMQGVLNLRVEEIAPSNDAAAGQAANLATLVTLARGFTQPLGANSANADLKDLLKTAEVTQKKNRVVVTAKLQPGMLAQLQEAEGTSAPMQPGTGSEASQK